MVDVRPVDARVRCVHVRHTVERLFAVHDRMPNSDNRVALKEAIESLLVHVSAAEEFAKSSMSTGYGENSLLSR